MSCLPAMEQKLWQIREHQENDGVIEWSEILLNYYSDRPDKVSICPPQYTSRGSVRHQTPDLFRPFLKVCSESAPLAPLQPESSPRAKVRLSGEERKKKTLYTTVPIVSSSLNPGWMSTTKKRKKEKERTRERRTEKEVQQQKKSLQSCHVLITVMKEKQTGSTMVNTL